MSFGSFLKMLLALTVALALGCAFGVGLGYRWWYKAPFPAMTDMLMELPVEEVSDGDTVRVRYGEKLVTVRLMGVDTPETKDTRKAKQCFGEDSSARTKQLLGKTLKFEFIAPDEPKVKRDRFDRPLAYVHLPDGTLFNETLLKEGYAHQYTFRGDYKYRDRFIAAQKDARARGVGIWGNPACEIQSRRPRQ